MQLYVFFPVKFVPVVTAAEVPDKSAEAPGPAVKALTDPNADAGKVVARMPPAGWEVTTA